MYYQRNHWTVPGHSLDHVTGHWNMIENRINSCDDGKLCLVSGTWLKTDSCHESKMCLDSLHVFFRISFLKKMFIYFTYLAAPGLGGSMQACWSLLRQAASLVIMRILWGGMWDVLPLKFRGKHCACQSISWHDLDLRNVADVANPWAFCHDTNVMD